MWEYDAKMWIFGGITPSSLSANDQLLSYDPCAQMWTNVAYSGDIPAPRSSASSAIVNHRVYVHGGNISNMSPQVIMTSYMNWICDQSHGR